MGNWQSGAEYFRFLLWEKQLEADGGGAEASCCGVNLAFGSFLVVGFLLYVGFLLWEVPPGTSPGTFTLGPHL